MRSTMLAFVLVLTTSFAGCGGPAAMLPATSHNGSLFELPGKKGFFEIKAQGGGTSRGSRAKAAANALVVFFYQPDGATELSPAPTEVTVKVGTAATSPVVPLSPQAKAGFASAPGHFSSGFRGQLNAKIDGEPVEVPFLIR